MAQDIKDTTTTSVVNENPGFEGFLQKNFKLLAGAVAAVVLVVGAWVGYSLYIDNLDKEASAAMYRAQMMFEQDSLDLALKGSSDFQGFLDIADAYGATQSGKLAAYYVGAIYLKKKDFDQAIEFLDKYSSNNGLIQARAWALMGDAYSEKNDSENAIKYYKKASGYLPNDQVSTIYMIKLGLAQELAGKFNDAIETYDVIIKEYPRSQDVSNAKKFKARATSLAASNQ
ncbi:MAG: tetratricopeptide repeat protein [Cytophagaceae bacterium]